ncbi:DUF3299 domain-containing protein [Emticicia agri]|uniref:DUF3299 domain-containing protein n=1 Tax=Emticicia agri TaxID=2492393 RepID=A0A4Q5LUZ9_9BACT|nr:DUF3299 domain-containing protein [Emticicia agri]RYU93327.1 DUF3299 domain-containing protein [Emticicia agri]
MKPLSNFDSLKISILLICSCVCFSWQVSPQKITWKELQGVRFTKRFNKKENMFFLYPSFSEKVKALEGREVEIRGYMIPVNPTENIYVLSAYPMAACFFCGGSGPESIIQLKMKKSGKYKTDEIWVVRGTLNLNADNIEELNYILQDTEPIKKVN